MNEVSEQSRDRLIDAEHGTWHTQNGGIDTTAVQQDRTLNHTANWLETSCKRNDAHNAMALTPQTDAPTGSA